MFLKYFRNIREDGVKVKYKGINLFVDLRFGFEYVIILRQISGPVKLFINKLRIIILMQKVMFVFLTTFLISFIHGTNST